MENGSRISGEKSSDECRTRNDDEGGEAVYRRALDGGKPQTKKARISPSLFRYDRFMQECLGPAYGMHTVRKPDRLGWAYSSP